MLGVGSSTLGGGDSVSGGGESVDELRSTASVVLAPAEVAVEFRAVASATAKASAAAAAAANGRMSSASLPYSA
jgi:hypothetical protein